jgi:RNA polymerase-binding transcription factor DksA
MALVTTHNVVVLSKQLEKTKKLNKIKLTNKKKERLSKMITLENKKCVEHNPMKSAISEIGDEQFTFCQDCENNIERWYNDTDPERLPMWSDWKVSK